MNRPSLLPVLLLLAAPGIATAELRVVTDIPVVEALTAEVMGSTGSPSVLIGPGSDPHSHQMRPSEARALAEADVVVWLGPAMTPWMDRVLEQSPGARQLALLDVAGTRLRGFGDVDEDEYSPGTEDHHRHDEGDAHDAGHGHEAAHGHDHADEDAHDHHGTDPHAWLYPGNAQLWLGAIAETLGTADPANAAFYAANAQAASARIAALDDTLEARLAPVTARPIVVFHDAYGYFADAFGVTIAGSVALGDAAAPGAQRMVRLRETIAREGVMCLFREPQHSPVLAEQVAEETGTAIGTLDPLGALQPAGPLFYDRLMTALADEILSCLEPGT